MALCSENGEPYAVVELKEKKGMELGRKQKLVVVKTVDFGVYLGDRPDAGERTECSFPAKEVPEGTKEGGPRWRYSSIRIPLTV